MNANQHEESQKAAFKWML